ncbi:MAG: 16S rRNA (cytidine(1402)-2'-O)-methyltransferase [Candidatus Kapabacteria bacterium]|nr:16S rRNA (cytidine(1402)-2'-O)-methyltransferase [Candidatus Kapabacteria bacterium]
MENNIESNQKQKRGTLYLVASPIGNNKDYTFRAADVLGKVDLVLGEEKKITAHHLYQLRLDKPIDSLNEHNEAEKVPEIIELLKRGKNIGLLSDDGTPVLADPGYQLVRACIEENINITPVPGASSIISALICSGFSTNQFLYAGFLSRIDEERRNQIKYLSYEPRPVIVLDTPYRLKVLLKAFNDIIPDRNAYIGMNLTLSSESHQRGTFAELYQKIKDQKIKVEYVIVFEGQKKDKSKINIKMRNISKTDNSHKKIELKFRKSSKNIVSKSFNTSKSNSRDRIKSGKRFTKR